MLHVLETATRLLDGVAGQVPLADQAAAEELLHGFVRSVEGPKSVVRTYTTDSRVTGLTHNPGRHQDAAASGSSVEAGAFMEKTDAVS